MNEHDKMRLYRRLFEAWWRNYPHAARACRVSAFDAFAAALDVAGTLRDGVAAADEECCLVAAVLTRDRRQAEAAACALADRVRGGRGVAAERPGHYLIDVSVLGPFRHGEVVERAAIDRVIPAALLARLVDLGSLRAATAAEVASAHG